VCLRRSQKQPVNPELRKKFDGIHSEKLFDEKLRKRLEKVQQVDTFYIVFVMYLVLYPFSPFLLS